MLLHYHRPLFKIQYYVFFNYMRHEIPTLETPTETTTTETPSTTTSEQGTHSNILGTSKCTL